MTYILPLSTIHIVTERFQLSFRRFDLVQNFTLSGTILLGLIHIFTTLFLKRPFYLTKALYFLNDSIMLNTPYSVWDLIIVLRYSISDFL